jgi:hypothetical protein
LRDFAKVVKEPIIPKGRIVLWKSLRIWVDISQSADEAEILLFGTSEELDVCGNSQNIDSKLNRNWFSDSSIKIILHYRESKP